MKDKRTKENFEELKIKLKGKGKEDHPLTNVETDGGVMVINGKPQQPKAHIIQL